MLSSISSKTTRYILSFILLLFLTCIYLVNLQSMETYKFFGNYEIFMVVFLTDI